MPIHKSSPRNLQNNNFDNYSLQRPNKNTNISSTTTPTSNVFPYSNRRGPLECMGVITLKKLSKHTRPHDPTNARLDLMQVLTWMHSIVGSAPCPMRRRANSLGHWEGPKSENMSRCSHAKYNGVLPCCSHWTGPSTKEIEWSVGSHRTGTSSGVNTPKKSFSVDVYDDKSGLHSHCPAHRCRLPWPPGGPQGPFDDTSLRDVATCTCSTRQTRVGEDHAVWQSSPSPHQPPASSSRWTGHL